MEVKLPENFDQLAKNLGAEKRESKAKKTSKAPKASEWYFVDGESEPSKQVAPPRSGLQGIGLRARPVLILLGIIIFAGLATLEIDFFALKERGVEKAEQDMTGIKTSEIPPEAAAPTAVAAAPTPVSPEPAAEVTPSATAEAPTEEEAPAEADVVPAPTPELPSATEADVFAEESPAAPTGAPLATALPPLALGTHVAPTAPARATTAGGDLEKWIDEDLAAGGWDKTGITLPMLNEAAETGMRTFRVCISGGKLHGKISSSDKMRRRGMSRVWYWVWGLLEMLEKYGSAVPDVDIVMQVEDTPKIPKSYKIKTPTPHMEHRTPGQMKNPPPPLFSPSKSKDDFDLLWPLWTLWGEDVVGAGPKTGGFHDPPWEVTLPKLVEAARKNPWEKRSNKNAYWRGAARTSSSRDALIACSNKPEFRVDASSVHHKLKIGKAISALDRVVSQYLVYLDGRTFSSAMLPMLPTGALVLLPSSPWETLHSRAFRSTGLFEPFDTTPSEVCANITRIIQHAESHTQETIAKTSAAVDWSEANLNIEMQKQYMLKMLQAYAKLQKFTPKPTGMKALSWKDVFANVKRRRIK